MFHHVPKEHFVGSQNDSMNYPRSIGTFRALPIIITKNRDCIYLITKSFINDISYENLV